jgi:predicted nucleic acid-binding protein
MMDLVDKSVLGHLQRSEVRTLFRQRLDRGELAMSTITLLEQRVSDQSPEDSRRFDRLVLSRVQLVQTEAADVERAREVQAQLLGRGQHRGPSVPDLLVAAVAERRGMTVLHLDRNFETIASITGQPEARIADLPDPAPMPARPPRSTGITQLRDSDHDRHAPRILCACCLDPIEDVATGTVHYHVAPPEANRSLEGRLAFAHAGCSHTRPVADYGRSAPMTEWLADLCRGLRVRESSPGVFELSSAPSGTPDSARTSRDR